MNGSEPAPTFGDALADVLLALRPAPDAALLRATLQLLDRERGDGHVCVALATWQARPPADGAPPFPPLPAWRAALRASGWCGDGQPSATVLPLVLDAADRLYLHRDHAAEQRLVTRLRALCAACPLAEPAAVARALAHNGLAAAAEPDWQLAAVIAGARSRLLVLTGGPGTGKTTTIARLLAVRTTLQPGLRIALAAPTGRAAARLHEALLARAGSLPGLGTAAADLVPRTLHRLLRYQPQRERFLAGPDAPLPFDLVVVDEVSMADPTLLAALVDALPPTASLVLVGDRDQLAAVAAGQVLGDLCQLAAPERGVGPELQRFVRAAAGMELPLHPAPTPLAEHVVALRTNWRFGAQPGLGGFAQALAARDAAAALAVLRAGHADLQPVAGADAALAALAGPLLAAARATDAAAALAALQRVRVLTATRHGPAGALAWNRRIEAWLAAHGHAVDDPWYAGRPVLVATNDVEQDLSNGDVGVVVRDADGRPRVAFAAAGGGVRTVAAVRLPPHETAWAMTVHKAQGSEYDEVLLAMPDRPGPWWQAPLIYTAVTRARQRALLLADESLLAAALAAWPARSSGLADGLRG